MSAKPVFSLGTVHRIDLSRPSGRAFTASGRDFLEAKPVRVRLKLCVSTGAPSDPMQAVRNHFGSVGRTMLSLYMSVTGGADWIIYYEILEYTGAERRG